MKQIVQAHGNKSWKIPPKLKTNMSLLPNHCVVKREEAAEAKGSQIKATRGPVYKVKRTDSDFADGK